VVRDIGLQQKAIKKIVNFAVEEMGLSLVGVVPSKIKGPKGNQEYLGYFRR
jgi:23S rRNA (cytidine1920-2'-O)/16S rRNA (cytidine1409-2'-O)-methyltransferase